MSKLTSRFAAFKANGYSKAYGAHHFGANWHDPEFAIPRPIVRMVFANKRGRVFRVAPGEWDIDHKWVNMDPRYRPYRQGWLDVGNVHFRWTQKRPGLGINEVKAERKVRGL